MTLAEVRRIADTQSTAEEINRALLYLDDFFKQNENGLSDSQTVDLIDLRAALTSRLSTAECQMPTPVPAVTPAPAPAPTETRTSAAVTSGLLAVLCAAIVAWVWRHRR